LSYRKRIQSTVAAAFAAAATVSAAASAEPLTYFTWAGYDDPAFRKPFTEKYGDNGVNFSFFSSPDEAFAKLKGGFQADIAHACLHDVRKWKEAGLIKPIDTAKVTTFGDLIPSLRDAEALTLDGQQWMIPWEWGASSVIYRTDKADLKEQSYAVLVDPAYQGRTALADAFDEVFQVAAILADVENPLELKEEEFALVEQKMREMRGNARFIWTEPSQLEQALASGEVDVAWGWPNSFAALKKQNVPVNFMLEPKEGLVTWQCGFTISATSTAPEAQLYDFIDALEAPESGEALVNNFGYGHSNQKALERVSKERLQELGLGGDANETIQNGNLMGPMPDEQRQRLIETWTQIKAGG
jgi:putative spermidine/putrescine transport system substrate-binding protein/spermidine/putrescine transport system substrate-binding protein